MGSVGCFGQIENIKRQSLVTDEEEITHIIDPLISSTLVLVHYRYLGRTHTPFEDIWKHNGDEPIYFRFYRLNPETDEEEVIADWGEDSIFFEERSWYKEYGGEEHYDEDNHLVDFFKLTFSLADNL